MPPQETPRVLRHSSLHTISKEPSGCCPGSYILPWISSAWSASPVMPVIFTRAVFPVMRYMNPSMTIVLLFAWGIFILEVRSFTRSFIA